ncbi:flagellar hook-basal body complex protein (plasmid) [Pontibacillus sp. ALD_SL1]|uniref:flagellar hook-basal body protein n=1 Tax=Pontibacillus sp. ALD_SL1 TaxID=2777185 RepID=UPI001A97A6A5|nr:flagellar hook-basal body complex protein [Pontibacillus sp. ALD_SL1]QST03055.1 flagellar hook-basal body complex protein [Pontibacillus sp. ALD_SL1]
MSGLYTGAMGMISHMQKLNVHSNNIANAETNGFKAQQSTFKVFQETDVMRIDSQGVKNIGGYQNQVYMDDIHTNYDTGNILLSEAIWDVALLDKSGGTYISFFQMKRGDDVYLSRNGHFVRDEQGNLTNGGGSLLLGEDGVPIKVSTGLNFSVSADGTIVDVASNERVGKISVVSVDKEHSGLLQRGTNGEYSVLTYEKILNQFQSLEEVKRSLPENPTLQRIFGSIEMVESIQENQEVAIIQPFTGELKQGFIETSNVNVSSEMVALLQTQKQVNASSKTLTIAQEILEMEANKLGN